MVEHILGKDEVTGSIPVVGSRRIIKSVREDASFGRFGVYGMQAPELYDY